MMAVLQHCINSWPYSNNLHVLWRPMLWAGSLRVCAKLHTYFITLVSQVGCGMTAVQSEPVRGLRLCCALLCCGALQVLRGPACQSTCMAIKGMFGDRRPCGWWTAGSWMEGWASQVLMYATYLFFYFLYVHHRESDT